MTRLSSRSLDRIIQMCWEDRTPFDMIKTQFKTVLLISHLDSLKDIVDKEISIEKNDGKAYVNE